MRCVPIERLSPFLFGNLLLRAGGSVCCLVYSIIDFVVTSCFFLFENVAFLSSDWALFSLATFSLRAGGSVCCLLSLMLPVISSCGNVAFPSSDWALFSVARFSWEREDVYVALSILLLSLLLPVVSFCANVAFLSSDWTLFSLETFSWDREGVFVALPILLLSLFMSTHYKNKWSYLTPKEVAAVNSKLHENLFNSDN